jgi:SAM-dependent methyltransferase
MDAVRRHYEDHPYPRYPLVASLRRQDVTHLKLDALWRRHNGSELPQGSRRILIAGCGSFAPYPFSLANPGCRITALDLSAANIKRARLHCVLHLRFNLNFIVGDLLDPAVASGPFGLIDAYGVLHHLPDPLAGLLALKQRLTKNGLLRIMLYSHTARRGTEAARRAVRRLGITDIAALEALYERLPHGSRLARRLAETPEGNSDHGLADAFLHPQVTTYRVAELAELLAASGLELLAFCHPSALSDPTQEWQRLTTLEANGTLDENYVLLLRNSGNTRQNQHK